MPSAAKVAGAAGPGSKVRRVITGIASRPGELLLAVTILLVWNVTYPLANDGSSHIYTAIVARNLLSYGNASPYAAYFYLASGAITNWAVTFLLLPLVSVAAPATIAKIAITVLMALSFAAVRYFLRSTGAGGPAVSVLSLFFTNTWFVWMGFWNFTLGTALCLLAIGYMKRRMSVLAASIAAPVIGLCHPLPLVLFGGMLMLFLWEDLQGRRPRAPDYALLGIALCSLMFIAITGQTGGGFVLRQSWREFAEAALYYPVDAFETVKLPYVDQRYTTAILAAMIAGASLEVVRKRQWWAAFGSALFAGGVGLFDLRMIAADAQAGGAYLAPRLSLYSFLLLTSWALPRVPFFRGAVLFAVLASSIVTTAGLWPMLRNVDLFTREFVAAGADARLVAGHTAVKVRYDAPALDEAHELQRLRMTTLLPQVADWIAADRGLTHLTTYEVLSTTFPVRMRPVDTDVMHALERLGDMPRPEHTADLRRVIEKLDVHYVIVLGESGPDWQSEPGTPGLFEVLNTHTYMLIGQRGSPAFIRIFARAAK